MAILFRRAQDWDVAHYTQQILSHVHGNNITASQKQATGRAGKVTPYTHRPSMVPRAHMHKGQAIPQQRAQPISSFLLPTSPRATLNNDFKSAKRTKLTRLRCPYIPRSWPVVIRSAKEWPLENPGLLNLTHLARTPSVLVKHRRHTNTHLRSLNACRTELRATPTAK